jgi:hypothetical protein
MDYYLKFENKEQADSVLYRVGNIQDMEQELMPAGEEPLTPPEPFVPEYVPNFANIDVLGTIYEQQEIIDPEDPPEPIALEGYHVNVRATLSEDTSALTEFSVTPQSPRRVWA